RLRTLVRGPAPGGLRADDVAQAIGVPLLTAMRPEPGLSGALERGGLRPKPHGPLTSAARTILTALSTENGITP
ncbi:MAG TPA: helicase, partial [Pseudonocardiaceae bacterium]|nr:helicase [Pseudonocardiaceae bacterium]